MTSRSGLPVLRGPMSRAGFPSQARTSCRYMAHAG